MKAFAVLLLLPCLAHAGSTVYKCQTAQGLVMQDVPCANTAETVSSNNYYAPAPTRSAPAPDGDLADEGVPGPGAHDEVANGAQVRTEGYQCSANGKTWVSKSPCPASTTTLTPVVGISGHDRYGNHVTGSGTMVGTTPVQQQQLDHDAFCAKLNERSPTSEHNKGQSSTYERNKQRQLNGC